MRDALKARDCSFICIFPSIKLEDVWYNRVAQRYKKDPTDKNLRALQRCATNYKKDIADLQTEDIIAIITDPDYNDLSGFLQNCEIQRRFGVICHEDKSLEFNTRPNKTIDDLWEGEIEKTLNEN